jgi:hypothetical protein
MQEFSAKHHSALAQLLWCLWPRLVTQSISRCREHRPQPLEYSTIVRILIQGGTRQSLDPRRCLLNRASAVLEPAAPARATPGAARAQRTHVLGLRTRKVETCERNESAERCSQWAASGIHRCGTAPHPEASSSPTRRTSTCRRTESPSAAHERSRSDPALSARTAWGVGAAQGAERRAASRPSAERASIRSSMTMSSTVRSGAPFW